MHWNSQVLTVVGSGGVFLLVLRWVPHSLTLNLQCVPHWPQTHDPLAFVFWGLGLQSCTITSGWNTDYNMTAFGKRAFKGVKCSLQCRALIYQVFCHSRNIKRNQRALWVCAWMNTEEGPHEDLWSGSDHKKIKQQPCQKPTCWHLDLGLRTWELWKNTFLLLKQQSVAFCWWQPELTITQAMALLYHTASIRSIAWVLFHAFTQCRIFCWDEVQDRLEVLLKEKTYRITKDVCSGLTISVFVLNITRTLDVHRNESPTGKGEAPRFGRHFIPGLALSRSPNAEVEQSEIVLLT